MSCLGFNGFLARIVHGACVLKGRAGKEALERETG